MVSRLWDLRPSRRYLNQDRKSSTRCPHVELLNNYIHLLVSVPAFCRILMMEARQGLGYNVEEDFTGSISPGPFVRHLRNPARRQF